MLVHYDLYPEDQEADCFADQAHSSRDPLLHLSAEQRVGRSFFQSLVFDKRTDFPTQSQSVNLGSMTNDHPFAQPR
jgi:hypothetical protein